MSRAEAALDCLPSSCRVTGNSDACSSAVFASFTFDCTLHGCTAARFSPDDDPDSRQWRRKRLKTQKLLKLGIPDRALHRIGMMIVDDASVRTGAFIYLVVLHAIGAFRSWHCVNDMGTPSVGLTTLVHGKAGWTLPWYMLPT